MISVPMEVERPTDGPVHLRWTLGRGEFVRGMASVMRSRIRVGFLFPIAYIAFLTVEWKLGDLSSRPDTWPLVLTILAATTLVAVIVAVLIKWLLPYWLLRRQWEQNPIHQDPGEAVITPDGLQLRGPDSDGTLQWTAFDQVLERGPLYLLRLRGYKKPHYVLIPRAAVTDMAKQDELGVLLRRYVASGSRPKDDPNETRDDRTQQVIG